MHTQDDFYQQLTSLQQRFDGMQPELEISVRDTALGVEGFIVVWNTAISRHGPLPNCAKGGTRIRQGLTLAEIKMLARNMAIKNAKESLQRKIFDSDQNNNLLSLLGEKFNLDFG